MWKTCGDNCTAMSGAATCMGQTFDHRCGNNLMGCPGSVVLDRAGWCPGQSVERRSVELDLGAGPVDVTASVPGLQGFFEVAVSAVYLR